jgi:NADPH:quinone reductase-like Zn-dependent oxidoreductase
MQAIIQSRYGTPDVLTCQEVERPSPGAREVLVRVHAAGASIGDHHLVTGKPYVIRLSPYCGLTGPKQPVLGAALAGTVEAVGEGVSTLRPGDAVFGEAPSGAYAEFAVVSEQRLAPKPANLSFEEAAATPWGVTALQALRDVARVQAGQRVLVNGASGGVGTWAVQLARALGAEVTAVVSTRNVALAQSLGASEVIDYTRQDFASAGARFDVLFDTVGNRSIADCRRALRPTGVFVSCSGGDSSLRWLARMVWMVGVSQLGRQRLVPFVVSPRREDLLALKELVEAGKARPVIERVFPLSEAASALRHVGAGHARGQTVLRIA